MSAQALLEGRFLGGRPPYGYRLADAGAHPNPDKAAYGTRLHRLEPDPETAPFVHRISEEYAGGKGLRAIAEGLTRDGVASPSAHDRLRNQHRSGEGWGKSAVNLILTNPKYTGFMVWNRQRRDEVLLEIEDVAAGHETRMRWNNAKDWVRSAEPAHPAIVALELFERAQAQRARNSKAGHQNKPKASPRPHLVRGLLYCGFCGRRMQGNWIHEQPLYRCTYPLEYALAQHVEHPRNVYLREKLVVPKLDDWLGRFFDPERIDETCEALLDGPRQAASNNLRRAAVRPRVIEADKKLNRYRAALDAGADPVVVAQWITDAPAAKQHAARELAAVPATQPLSAHGLRQVVEGIGGMVKVLASTEPAKKASLYENLGMHLTYDVPRKTVRVVADLAKCRYSGRVGEGT